MSEKARIEHVIECSEDTFWSMFLDEKYNQALFQGYLKFPLWRVSSLEDGEPVMKRVVEVEPYVADLPGAIKKVLGENIRYREEGKYDKQKRRYEVEVVPARLADKIFVKGVQSTQALGPKQCKRVFEIEVTVKIFGVGGMIEKRIISDLQRSYDLGAKFQNRYIAENGL